MTFNFDFTASGVVPAPPYPLIQFEPGVNFATVGPGEFGLWRGFSELDGGGSVIFGPFSTNLLATLLPDGDGVFSMVLSVVTGSFTVDPIAYGFGNNTLLTAAVAPTSVSLAAVPEPATLTLVGFGIAAAWRGRRRSAL